MKLLKFVCGDAPQTMAGGNLTHDRLTFTTSSTSSSTSNSSSRQVRGKASSSDGDAATTVVKAWRLQSPAQPIHGSYWLLDDDDKPICALHDVCFATPEQTTTASSSSSTGTHALAMPRGVTDDHVRGVDLRSKLGQQLERTRHEYGTTYKTASKSAHMLMNAEEVTAKKQERQKRARAAVAEALEAGESLQSSSSRRRVAAAEREGDGGDGHDAGDVAAGTAAVKRRRRESTRQRQAQ